MNLWQGFFFIFITSILGYQPVNNNRITIIETVSTLVDRQCHPLTQFWLASYLDDVSLHPHTSGPCHSQTYVLSKIWNKQLFYHIFTLCPLLLDSSDFRWPLGKGHTITSARGLLSRWEVPIWLGWLGLNQRMRESGRQLRAWTLIISFGD